MKRKAIKITLIITSIIIVLVIALALSISSIAKSYIEKNSKELIGRKVQMKDLHINIFTGTLRLDSIRMFEANDKEVFASIDSFFMNLTLHQLISKNIEISEITVIRPSVVILQNKDKFNFDDLMPKKNKKDTVKSSFPKLVTVKNIYIKGGKIVYTDQQLHNTITMNDLGVSIPELIVGRGNTKAGIHLNIGSASLDSHLSLNMKSNQYQLDLSVKNLPIHTFYPYAKQQLNLGKLEGILNTDFHIMGNMNHIMNFTLCGTADGKGLNITNGKGEAIASAGIISTKIDKIYLPTSTYLFDYIHASNVNLSFMMMPTTNNFTNLMLPTQKNAASSATSAQPMSVKIKDLNINESQLTFTDKTLKIPFSLPMRKISILATNFDMNSDNEFKIKAIFPEGGNLRMKWKGNFNDYSNQQIMVNLQNMSIKLFSPYCVQYTAYELADGNLNFTSKSTIRQNNINSLNLLDAYKATAGNKHKELKPEYHVPLKLALYVLKDKDDKIKFDIPVKGNIKDPKFSYSKIVFQTIVNLMVKIAVSPVRFLAGALGMNSDKMEAIAIEPLQTDFSAEQYRQLNDLASIVKKKPEMTLTLTQFINLKDVLPDYSLYKAKSAFLLSLIKDESKKRVNNNEVLNLKNDDPQFVAYLNALVKAKGTVTEAASLQEKINAIYPADSLQNELHQLLEKRNEMLRNYMITSYEVPAKNLVVKTADKAALDAYAEKAKYKIEMHLPGDEVTDNAANVKK